MFKGILQAVLENEDLDDDEPIRNEGDLREIWSFDLPCKASLIRKKSQIFSHHELHSSGHINANSRIIGFLVHHEYARPLKRWKEAI